MEEINSLRVENNKIILIGILFIFLFFWYAQLTNIAGGPISFIKTSFSNLGDIFNEDVQAKGSSPLQNILLFSKSVNYGNNWIEYKEDLQDKYPYELNKNSFYDLEDTSKIQQSIIFPKGLEPKKSYNINISFTRTLLEFLGRIFIVLGVFFFFIYSRRKKKKVFLNIISISFLVFLIMAVFLPFFTFYYNLARFYQQFLIILSLFFPIGLFFILKPIFKDKSYFIIATFIALYILIFLGVFYQLTGGTSSAMRLNNVGFEYDLQYIHSNELFLASWFIEENNGEVLYIDNYANLRLLLSQKVVFRNKISDIVPSVIKKKSYVYSSYTNTLKEVTIRVFKEVSFPFNFPTEFLNKNKNKIYNNGGSEIFK